MSKEKLTINITKLEDSGCIAYKAVIQELKWTVLAETMKDLFEAIESSIEIYDEEAMKTLVQV